MCVLLNGYHDGSRNVFSNFVVFQSVVSFMQRPNFECLHYLYPVLIDSLRRNAAG